VLVAWRTDGTAEPIPGSTLVIYGIQITVSDSTGRRPLTENANAATDDTPETPTALLDQTRRDAPTVSGEQFLDLPTEGIDRDVSHRTRRFMRQHLPVIRPLFDSNPITTPIRIPTPSHRY
jgi:hypothetical protein